MRMHVYMCARVYVHACMYVCVGLGWMLGCVGVCRCGGMFSCPFCACIYVYVNVCAFVTVSVRWNACSSARTTFDARDGSAFVRVFVRVSMGCFVCVCGYLPKRVDAPRVILNNYRGNLNKEGYNIV